MANARKGATRRPNRPNEAYWCRGYLGHVYRSASGEALGRVRRVGRPCVGYAWQTAHARSTAPDLATAKRCVELSVLTASVQPDLFVPHDKRLASMRVPTWPAAAGTRDVSCEEA